MDAAQALSQEAGWNQVAADWRIFLDMGDVIGLTRGGKLIATAAMLPFGSEFAWISMVLVTATERRQGLARWLLTACVEKLRAQNLVPILDATPAGRIVYVGLGFRDCWTMKRLSAKTVRSPTRDTGPSAVTVRPVAPQDWPAITAYDRVIFGADRSLLLRSLVSRLPASALVAEQQGQIVGCLFGRDGRTMNQFGPLAAVDEEVARALLTRAIASVPPPLTIDLPDRHAALRMWLISLGFQPERPLTRMAYGRSESFDDSARLFAIAGPELG